MSEDWKKSVMVPIYKGKGDVTNCRAYRGVKSLEHEDYSKGIGDKDKSIGGGGG